MAHGEASASTRTNDTGVAGERTRAADGDGESALEHATQTQHNTQGTQEVGELRQQSSAREKRGCALDTSTHAHKQQRASGRVNGSGAHAVECDRGAVAASSDGQHTHNTHTENEQHCQQSDRAKRGREGGEVEREPTQRSKQSDAGRWNAQTVANSAIAQHRQQHTQETQTTPEHSQQSDGGSVGGSTAEATEEMRQQRWMRSHGGSGAGSAKTTSGARASGSSNTAGAREEVAGLSQNRAASRVTEESRKRRWSMRSDTWRAGRRREGARGESEHGAKRRRVSVASQVEVSMLTVQRIVGGTYDVGDSHYGAKPLKRAREAGSSDGRYERDQRRQRRATGDG